VTGYLPKPEERLTALACIGTIQLCNDFGKGEECSPWTGVVRGENNETGLEEFFKRCSDKDKGMISLLFPFKSIGQTLGQVASGMGSNLMATRALLSVPNPISGQLVELQTAQGEDQWKAEGSQCMALSI
jgi:hypothetical protein